MSLRGLDIFLKYHLSDTKSATEISTSKLANKTDYDIDRIEKLLSEPKFWKYAKDSSLKVKKNVSKS